MVYHKDLVLDYFSFLFISMIFLVACKILLYPCMQMIQALTVPLNLFQKLIKRLTKALKGWIEGDKLSFNVAKIDVCFVCFLFNLF